MIKMVVIWLAKQALAWGINRLCKHWGIDLTQAHVTEMLINAQPLKLDENPPLSVVNNPNIKNHYQ